MEKEKTVQVYLVDDEGIVTDILEAREPLFNKDNRPNADFSMQLRYALTHSDHVVIRILED
jgi:hypothetical protein